VQKVEEPVAAAGTFGGGVRWEGWNATVRVGRLERGSGVINLLFLRRAVGMSSNS